VKAFLAKAWTGLQWVWAVIVSIATWIRDFAVWCKNRGAKSE
jgi:hypothetical protein